jgi:hypothetical protein
MVTPPNTQRDSTPLAPGEIREVARPQPEMKPIVRDMGSDPKFVIPDWLQRKKK